MPTYEYACKDCGEHLDVVQSFHDDPLTECPNCGGNLRKVFSAAGIIFRGSGWHVKDYAAGGSGAANGSSGADSSTGGDSSSDTSTTSSDTSSSGSTSDTASSTSDSGSTTASA